MTSLDTRTLAFVSVVTAGTALLAITPTPAGLTPAGQRALATMAFAGVLWVTGALPLSVTALTVPVWLTVFGVTSTFEAALSGFADPIIFLFLGTFVLAGALRKHGVDRRVALALVAAVGTTPRRVVLGTMVATAILSMAISNTATAAMMAPVALGLVDGYRDVAGVDATNMRAATLLGVAYAASIGGLGTLVGTPPNAIVVGQLRAALGVEVTFLEWLLLGLPVVVVTLPLAWFLLVALYPPGQARDVVVSFDPAPLDRDARLVAAVFAVTAGLWVIGGLGFALRELFPATVATALFGGPGPGLFGSGAHQGLLFVPLVALLPVPALVLLGVVDESDVVAIDWSTLLLFGGGLSLADALVDTGATDWLADAVFGSISGVSLLVLLAVVVLLTVALSELASNTATVAILAPVLVEVGRDVGPGFGLDPAAGGVLLAISSAVAASFGFALPVATPPNAIVYGTGEVTRDQMLRAGLLLDVLLAAVTTALLFGFAFVGLPVG